MNTTLQVSMTANKTSKTESRTGSVAKNVQQAPKQNKSCMSEKTATTNNIAHHNMAGHQKSQSAMGKQSALPAPSMSFNMSATSAFVPSCQ